MPCSCLHLQGLHASREEACRRTVHYRRSRNNILHSEADEELDDTAWTNRETMAEFHCQARQDVRQTLRELAEGEAKDVERRRLKEERNQAAKAETLKRQR